LFLFSYKPGMLSTG